MYNSQTEHEIHLIEMIKIEYMAFISAEYVSNFKNNNFYLLNKINTGDRVSFMRYVCFNMKLLKFFHKSPNPQ